MEEMIYSDGVRHVFAVGDEGGGGERTCYAVHGNKDDGSGRTFLADVAFQHDTIPKVGVVAWTNEALLAVIRHRLRSFQAGPFACNENANALEGVEGALISLESRTADRKARGVEGKHEA